MARKKTSKVEEGYTPEEARALMHKYIEESMERLRERLRDAWKAQAAKERRIRHGLTV
ncbi:MAG: hypothetical protein WAX57_02105 [Minisyncoccia bacterium]